MDENSVLDVSRYTVECSFNIGSTISNLRLQKLLYFIQGFKLFYTNGDHGMFRESIVAWKYGPVVRESYFAFKNFGRLPITDYKHIKTIEFDGKIFLEKDIEWKNPLITDDKELISCVVKSCSKLSNARLVEITHDVNGPWSDYYDEDESNIIPRNDIYQYFKRVVDGK